MCSDAVAASALTVCCESAFFSWAQIEVGWWYCGQKRARRLYSAVRSLFLFGGEWCARWNLPRNSRMIIVLTSLSQPIDWPDSLSNLQHPFFVVISCYCFFRLLQRTVLPCLLFVAKIVSIDLIRFIRCASLGSFSILNLAKSSTVSNLIVWLAFTAGACKFFGPVDAPRISSTLSFTMCLSVHKCIWPLSIGLVTS